METLILKYIESVGIPIPTLQISKEICGKDGTCKMVNPTLYKLVKEGKIMKHSDANGANPRWYISETRKMQTK